MSWLIDLISSQVFQTVITGVIVFTAGQIILKFILESLLEYKKSVGRITYELRLVENIFIKFRALNLNLYLIGQKKPDTKSVVIERLEHLASELESNYVATPWKTIFKKLNLLPTEGNIDNAGQHLIYLCDLLSDPINKDTELKSAIIKEIRKRLNIDNTHTPTKYKSVVNSKKKKV